MSGLLHIHSMYSINDSGSEPINICNRAKELGYTSVTLTDHGTLLGIIPFMECKNKCDINTVPGIEAYLENGEHFIIIAKDYDGFKSISYANTAANNNINKHPIMSNDILEKYFKGNEHVIATTACIGGPISKILLSQKRWKIKKQKKLDPLIELSQLYEEYNKQYKHFKGEELSIKEQIKELKPFVSKAYINATEKANNKLSDKEIIVRKGNTIQAQKTIDDLNNLLKEAAENRKKYKKLTDKLKPKKERYLELKKEFESNKPTGDLYEQAKNKLSYFNGIFPNLYVEVQNHNLEDEAFVMPQLAKMARELNIPLIAGNDAHLVYKGEENMRNLLRFNMFKKHMKIEEVDKTLYIKSIDELKQDLSKILEQEIVTEALKNLNVLDSCNVIFPKEKHYPSVNSELSFDDLLEEERQKRIKEGTWNDTYQNRLETEVSVIKSMGFVDYHMVVRDFCIMGRKLGVIPEHAINEIPKDFSKIDKWIEKRGYRVGVGIGPGRGSAAGSLVCNMLKITNIDPIKYNLLFERFLNPERVTMPDIDTDVSKALRPVIIKYLQWRYGESAICSITTETTYGAKNAIRLAGRDRADELYGSKKENEAKRKKYMNMVDSIASLTGDELGVKVKDIEKEFNNNFSTNKEAIYVYNNAKLIEGKISGTGIHAGGVVISDNDCINDYIPLAWNDKKNVWAAQCDMNKLEENGLIKMDLLGLQTLDVISNCLQLILQHTGKVITEYPFEDEVFEEIFAKGNTNSIFQFESNGMKNLLRQFKPTCFEDIILLNACYRPGPLQYIDGSNEINLIKRKNNEQKITYLVPELEPILKDTYGGIIYQESVMQIFKDLAGYSLGGADMVRRAMSKKKTEVLNKEREAFVYGDKDRNIKGCIANGIPEDKANKLFDDMMDFARYAFNKSHSTAYASVAYQCAYLKYHYPVEYLCSMFNQKDIPEYAPILEDCNEYNIKILAPDINRSYYEFTILDGNINYGFKGIKGIAAKNTIDTLIYNRNNEYGGYVSLKDFMLSNSNDNSFCLNKSLMDSLIYSGCFQSIIPNREQTYEIYRTYKSCYNSKKSIQQIECAMDNIDNIAIDMKTNQMLNYKNDIEYMGAIISDNPLRKYQEDEYYNCTKYNSLTTNKMCSIMGYILNAEKGVTKQGKPKIELELQGHNGKLKVYLMGNIYTEYNYKIYDIVNKVVKIKGKYSFGIFFAEDIMPHSTELNTYLYVCDDITNYKKLLNLLNNNNNEKDAILLIENYVTQSLEISPVPCVKPFYVSMHTIKAIGAINEKDIGINV